MKQNVYATDEYKVVIGEPVVSAEVKASSTSVAIPCDAIPDGNYLVTLSVNSVTVADRDTFSFASGSCTVGDYTLAYSSYAVTVSTTSNNDIVRLKIEPVEVYVTDAMKAAVVKVTPEAPSELPAVESADKGKFLHANESTGALEWAEGGGSGGGVLVVNGTWNEAGTECTLDKTWTEIRNADLAVVKIQGEDGVYIENVTYVYEYVPFGGGDMDYRINVYDLISSSSQEFVASAADGYPVYSE